jgi:hypothetical protein
MLTINIGHQLYGYRQLELKNQMLDYIHGAKDYVGEFAESSKQLAKGILSVNKDSLKKYAKILFKSLTILTVAFYAIHVDPISAFAPTSGIDIKPIENFSMEIYWTMLKAILYISIPIFAWIGYIFAFAGTNAGKRSAAKTVLISVIGGIAFVAGAPWGAHQIYNLCRHIFNI